MTENNNTGDRHREELQRAVEYIQESDEPLDSKIKALQKSVEAGGFTMDEVLSAYADAISTNNMIYPMEESQLREIHRAAQRATSDGTVSDLQTICSPNTLIETADDVITETINIYSDESNPIEDRQQKIKSLVKDARRDGIDISNEQVVRALEDFEASTTTTDDDVDEVSVDVEDVELASGIETPEEIIADREYIYRIEADEEADINSIEWYIGGTLTGTGETILHTFEYPGVYTVSVELTDKQGRTDHVSQEIEVTDASVIDVSILGETDLEAGETVEYTADIETDNETVQLLEWELDNVDVGTGKVFSNTFENDGTHTLSVTAHGASGLTVTETESITVDTPTGIDVTIDAPETVLAGDTVDVHCSIEVENSYIENTTCKVGDDVIDVGESSEITFEYTFDKPGEYPITVTSTNNNGDSDTSAATVDCFVEPTVEITTDIDEVVRGDAEVIEIAVDDRLDVNWGVNNASLTSVSDDEAEVTFNSGIADEASVTAEVENGNGDTGTDTLHVSIHEPRVDAEITVPDEITAGRAIQMSADETVVEHAQITRIEWKLGDGMIIGEGEEIMYEFPSPGEYTVSMTVHTDRQVGDTARETVSVDPETDVTAVIVTEGGPSTRDEFTITAEKSVAENTTIESYEWEIESLGEFTGEAQTVSFDSPGDFEVELTVETEAGDVDTDTAVVTVEQYTDVSAEISGPTEIKIGDQAKFDARASQPTNTTITDYEWRLNEQPAGAGEVFTQTFSNPGHYSITLEVTTATGDTDTASHGVMVEKPKSVVDADLEVKVEDTPKTKIPVTITGKPTTIENGEFNKFLWTLNGDELTEIVHTIQTVFEDYGEAQIEMTAIAEDGVEDTVEKSVYVSPAVSDPPYDELDEDDVTTADILSAATEIYQDTRLTDEDQDRFAAHLVLDAEEYGVDIDPDEIIAHLEDIDEIDDEAVTIDPDSVRGERQYRFDDPRTDVEFETAAIPALETEDDDEESVDAGGWDTGDSSGGSGSSVSPEDVVDPDSLDVDTDDTGSGIDDESGGEWDFDEPGDDGDGTVAGVSEEDVAGGDGVGLLDEVDEGIESTDSDGDDEDSSTEGSDEELQETDGDEDEDEDDGLTYEEKLLGEDTDLDEAREELEDGDKQDRISPETYDLGDSVLSMPNYAQDLMDFEYILDKDDELLPDGVNGAGVVVTEDETYVAIARVEGRDWSIHTPQKKHDIINTYQSNVLSGLDNPIQILSVPTRFDIRDHIQMVNEVLEENSDDEEELLMNIGRSIYPNWIEDFMVQNDMKERQFYIVMAMSAEQLHEFKSSGESVTEQLADAPVIGNVFSKFTEDKKDDITKYQCLRELNTRMNRLKSNLRRMDITLERVDSRDEAMAALYHYYHNAEPEREVFPTGPFTHRDQDASIGNVDIQNLLTEHEPAHEGVTDAAPGGGITRDGD